MAALAFFPKSGVAPRRGRNDNRPVLTSSEVLTELKTRGVSKSAIARALGLPAARITEMYYTHGVEPIPEGTKSQTRKLSWDEGAVLYREFNLGGAEPPTPGLSRPVARLVAQVLARKLGIELDPESRELQELAATLQAWSRFDADPHVRGSVEAAMGFFLGLELHQEQETVALLEDHRPQDQNSGH